MCDSLAMIIIPRILNNECLFYIYKVIFHKQRLKYAKYYTIRPITITFLTRTRERSSELHKRSPFDHFQLFIDDPFGRVNIQKVHPFRPVWNVHLGVIGPNLFRLIDGLPRSIEDKEPLRTCPDEKRSHRPYQVWTIFPFPGNHMASVRVETPTPRVYPMSSPRKKGWRFR